MKAVLQFRASPGFRRRIDELKPDWLEVEVVEVTERERFGREMKSAEVLLHVLEPVTGPVIEAAPDLGLIQKIGVGVDTIDLETARAHGVAVANMPGTNSRAVAELALMLILATLRRVGDIGAATRAGEGWALEPHVFDTTGEIHGRTVGLVGYGAVARTLAPMLAALGTRVLCTTRREPDDGVPVRRALAELLAESDIVSLHVPLTPETAELMNAETLGQMKTGSLLINTARGGLVVEADLAAALESGHLGGAGLDVFAAEPVSSDNPLFALPNVVVTPHVAWLTPETLERSLGVAFENCRRLRDGEPLLNQIE